MMLEDIYVVTQVYLTSNRLLKAGAETNSQLINHRSSENNTFPELSVRSLDYV